MIEPEKPRGQFEVRWWPNKHPDEIRRLYGHADEGIGGWYVVIDNGGGIVAPWAWGRGLSWVHPHNDLHGTFEQILTPIDDEARRIMAEVWTKQRTFDKEAEKHRQHIDRVNNATRVKH